MAIAATITTAASLAMASPALADFTTNMKNANGKCLSLSGGVFANNTKAVQWTCGGGLDQLWSDIDEGNPNDGLYYELNPSFYPTKCLGVAADSTATNAQIVIYDCIGVSNQRWRKESTSRPGYYRYKNLRSGYYLSVSGGNTGTNVSIVQWPWNGGNDQHWKYLS
ncbi:RICIN domain-containing protein [Micromonospora sp. NPDC051300]|uniref:RICIN domain-containing protein n=1 Tax=Micromonospora sp. NPDC051300 TaxID=3364286 RepID=UPI0037904A97